MKDYPDHEIAALIHFMYRGEVRVSHANLPGLMRAATSLQVRGLISDDNQIMLPPDRPVNDLLLVQPSTPEGAQPDTPEDDDNDNVSIKEPSTTPTPFHSTRDHRERLSQIGHLNHSIRELRENCNSPLMPRRKQARPRRRSGELVPQDLSKFCPQSSSSPIANALNFSTSQYQSQQQYPSVTQNQQLEDEILPVVENLSMKKSVSPIGLDQHYLKTEDSETGSSPRVSPLTGTNLLHPDGSLSDIPSAAVAAAAASIPAMSALSLTSSHHHNDYLTNLSQLAQWLPGQNQLPPHAPPPPQSHHQREGSPHGSNRVHSYQQQHQNSPLTHRRSTVPTTLPFPLDNMTLNSRLFPHASALERSNLLADLHDSFNPETIHGLFNAGGLGTHHTHSGKKRKHRGEGDASRRWSDQGSRGLPTGRPKGQHSAPRGGPPRSWTNAELTEALQHVWNKKMTTSQASRIFGIPYNSLLMYVRGKYGKSLKLEQLRKDCTGTAGEVVMNSLNNNIKTVQQPAQLGHPLAGLPPHPGDDGGFSHHPLLGANLSQNFFHDFTTYPVPVSMVHILPPSEQKAFEPPNSSGGVAGGGGVGGGGGSGCGGSISGSISGSRSGSGGGSSGGDLAISRESQTPSPVVDHHHHQPSLQPQSTQSAPALLQQNGSD